MRETSSKEKYDHFNNPHELFKTHIGGAALVEGVMMRGKYNWALAVRTPTGEIYTEEHELEPKDPSSIKAKPFIRGWFALIDAIKLNNKAMNIAIEHAYPEEDVSVADDAADTETVTKPQDLKSRIGTIVGTVLAALVAIVVFNVLPSMVANLICGDYSEHPFWWNTVQNILQIALFALYVWLISMHPDMHRLFGYHGAEHQTIHCYEHGLELNPQNAGSFTRLHVRCGTAFIVMTAVLSIIIFTVLPLDRLLDATGLVNEHVRLALIIMIRLLLIPVVTGITYEVTVVWAGKHSTNWLVKALLWPGLMMQYLTTKQASPEMLECAIAAMNLVIDREKRGQRGREHEAVSA